MFNNINIESLLILTLSLLVIFPLNKKRMTIIMIIMTLILFTGIFNAVNKPDNSSFNHIIVIYDDKVYFKY